MPSGIYKRTEKTKKNLSLILSKKWKNPQYKKRASKMISLAKQGAKHHLWKGGRYKSDTGYILVKNYTHPFRTKQNYIPRSHLIIEKHLGRYLKSTEIVHHINGIRDDDRIENFMIFKTDGYHLAFHHWNYYNPKYIIFDGRETVKKTKRS